GGTPGRKNGPERGANRPRASRCELGAARPPPHPAAPRDSPRRHERNRMRSLNIHRNVALAVTLAVIANPLIASAGVGDGTTDRIIGQPNASSDWPNTA